MLERINQLLVQNVDFAIETTLTTLSYQKTIELAKLGNYNITLLFFWLNDVNLAIERVKSRVLDGGHNIPEEVIIRRYYRGVSNLIHIFLKLSDYWLVIDNSKRTFALIAEGNEEFETTVYDDEIWTKLKEQSNEK